MPSSCAICLESFTTEDNVQATKCGHLFHISCLTHWLRSSRTCPKCRKRCTHEDRFRVYLMNEHSDLDSTKFDKLQQQMAQLQLQNITILENHEEFGRIIKAQQEKITILKSKARTSEQHVKYLQKNFRFVDATKQPLNMMESTNYWVQFGNGKTKTIKLSTVITQILDCLQKSGALIKKKELQNSKVNKGKKKTPMDNNGYGAVNVSADDGDGPSTSNAANAKKRRRLEYFDDAAPTSSGGSRTNSVADYTYTRVDAAIDDDSTQSD